MTPGELDATYTRRFNAHLAYRNRVWCSKVGTTVQPWTHSMLDFRKMALA